MLAGIPKRDIQYYLRKISSMTTSLSSRSHFQNEIFESFRKTNVYFNQAIFNFCIDFEWGLGNAYDENLKSELPLSRRIQDYQNQKENFFPFVKMLSSLQFKTSWSIVAKILDMSHVPPRDLQFAPLWGKNWYEGFKEIPSYQALDSDMLALIKNNASFEILSHGLAHIDYQDDSTTEEIARYDLEMARTILRDHQIEPCGMVFPCNKLGFLDLLAPQGYQIVRGDNHLWRKEQDLTITPIGFWISPGRYSFREVKEIIDFGVELKAFIHPWMHLSECDQGQRDLERFYYPLFEYINKLEMSGKLRNLSFNQISSEMASYEF